MPEQTGVHGSLLFSRLQSVPMRIPRVMVELMEKTTTTAFPDRIVSKVLAYNATNLAVSKDSPITIPFHLDLNHIHPDVDESAAATTSSPIISHTLRVTIRVLTPKNEYAGWWKSDLIREERFEVPVGVRCTPLPKRDVAEMSWKEEGVESEDVNGTIASVKRQSVASVDGGNGKVETNGDSIGNTELQDDSEDEVLHHMAARLRAQPSVSAPNTPAPASLQPMAQASLTGQDAVVPTQSSPAATATSEIASEPPTATPPMPNTPSVTSEPAAPKTEFPISEDLDTPPKSPPQSAATSALPNTEAKPD
ncbi:hypothetical protein HDV00_012718, partial [Rhizophlyctis rosea]